MGLSLGISVGLTSGGARDPYGPEEVVNGTDLTDTTGWIGAGSASIAAVTENLEVTSTTAWGFAAQDLAVLNDGNTYVFVVDFISTTGASGKADIKISNPHGTFQVAGGGTVGQHTFNFTGSSSYNTISLGDYGDASAVTVFNNVSAKEIL